MNIEDLTQAVDQAGKVHAFVYKHWRELGNSLFHHTYAIWNDLEHALADMEKKACEEDRMKTDDLSRITAQIVAESAHQKAVMAAAMSGIDRIMAEYHDDIKEAS